MKNKKRAITSSLFIYVFLISFSVCAVVETYEFDNSELEHRYQHFTEVLRCPKCQNQNLSGSNSSIATDLRRELAAQLKAGKSDQEIIDFMVARFGDFVLYEPPFKKSTWFLWSAPAGLLFCALVALVIFLRKRIAVPSTENIAGDLESVNKPSAGMSPQKSRIALLLLFVLAGLGAYFLYRELGASDALRISSLSQSFYQEVEKASAKGELPSKGAAAELILILDKHLQTHPDDLQSQYLLGSTFALVSQFDQAIPYYKTYLMAVPTDERVLTEYVQILYVAAGRQLTERVQFVVNRALDLNPHNQEVLGLLAMHSFESGAYKEAATYWQKILLTVEKDDPAKTTLEQAITEANQRAAAQK